MHESKKKFPQGSNGILGVMYQEIYQRRIDGRSKKKDKKLAIINIDVCFTNELFSKYFTETPSERSLGFLY
jgi:hypothetical protein